MNTKLTFLLFFMFQFSIIIGYTQSDNEIESIYNSYASIDDDFKRLDSLRSFIHPKNGGDMRQSIMLLNKERTSLGTISKKPLQHLILDNLLFKCHRSINEYQKGVSYLVEGKEIADKYSIDNEQWERALADLNLELAFVNYLEQKPNRALSNATQAINSYKNLGDDKKLAEAYWRLGIAKSQMGNSIEALTYYEDAEELINPENDKRNYLRVQYLKSIELTNQNKFSKARTVLLETLPEMETANHPNYAVALAKMGQVETQLGNLLPAKKYLEEAEALKINSTDLNAKGVIAHRFEEYYLATGQFQEAYDKLAVRKSIADSISRKRIQDESVAFQSRFTELNQQQKTKDLKYEQVIHESKLKSYLGLGAGLLLALLSFFGWMWSRKEKRKAEAELLKSKETELASAKKEISESVTNNLRTPLALINGQLHELQNEALSNHAAMLLVAFEKTSKRLLSQVNQLKDTHKMADNGIVLNETDGALILFLEEVFGRFKRSSADKDFKWEKSFEQHQFICKLDYEKLNSILSNLLSNAIKYCPVGSEIKLAFHQKRDFIIIEVIDNGPGIEHAHQQHVFNWYYRDENNNPESVKTSGYGLALSKELATMMNGTLMLNSNVDQGCHFVLELPFKKVDEETQDKYNNLMTNPGAAHESITPIVAPLVVGEDKSENNKDSHPKLLLVEDQEDFSKHIESILADKYSITSFPTGSAAESWAMENLPDVILTGLALSDMSGFELSKSLKSNFLTDHIPILVLTSRADDELQQEVLAAKADDVLTKPFDEKEIILRLNNLIEKNKVVMNLNEEEKTNGKSVILTNPFLKKLYAVIAENFNDPEFNDNKCAQLMYISSAQLSKKTNILINETPDSVITHFRIDRSNELLQVTDLPVEDIANLCGFYNAYDFNTAYNRIKKVSPSQYRSELSKA